MLFRAEKGLLEYRGQVLYARRDWSFDFVPHQMCGCSILIDIAHPLPPMAIAPVLAFPRSFHHCR